VLDNGGRMRELGEPLQGRRAFRRRAQPRDRRTASALTESPPRTGTADAPRASVRSNLSAALLRPSLNGAGIDSAAALGLPNNKLQSDCFTVTVK